MPEDPVTLGELGRRMSDLKYSIEQLSLHMVTRDVWQVEQKRITEWIARIEREHVALETRYDTDRERYEERRRTRTEGERQQRINDRRLVYGAILTGVCAFLVAILTRLYGGT